MRARLITLIAVVSVLTADAISGIASAAGATPVRPGSLGGGDYHRATHDGA